MRVFSISGFSGTGKTVLVESIVKTLVSQGQSVITVKSSQHEPKESKETDTERHKLAGAIATFFRGPSTKGKSLKEIVGAADGDFLIIEGMKTSPIPKVWLIGKSTIGDTIPMEVKAIISWNANEVEDKYGIPILDSGDIEGIISIIMQEAVELDVLDV
jgi:molybdopterin-guanine dinucleotide biosynthesis protein MobB